MSEDYEQEYIYEESKGDYEERDEEDEEPDYTGENEPEDYEGGGEEVDYIDYKAGFKDLDRIGGKGKLTGELGDIERRSRDPKQRALDEAKVIITKINPPVSPAEFEKILENLADITNIEYKNIGVMTIAMYGYISGYSLNKKDIVNLHNILVNTIKINEEVKTMKKEQVLINLKIELVRYMRIIEKEII